MRKFNDLGKRAAALALAAGLALSTVPPVLAADTEGDTPTTQTQQQDVGGYEPIEESDLKPADDGVELYAWKPHGGACSRDVLLETEPATCTKAERKKWKCTKNFHFENWWEENTSPKLGHDFDEAAIAALKPCQTKTFTCRRDGCGATKTITATAPHTPGEWEMVSYPTCTENGKRVKKCTECGEILKTDTESEDMKALDHDFVEEEEKATCTKAGGKYKVCQREGCGHRETIETYPALEHLWDEGTVTQEYPCVEGVRTYRCTRQDCDGINAEKSEKVEPAEPHIPDQEWTVVTKPTCEQKGQKVKYCTVCHNVVETEEIPKLGHEWGKYVDDNKPGCQQQTATAHCTREGCTATDTQNTKNFGADGKPRPHRYTHWVTVGFEDGTYAVTRSACDYGCGEVQRHTENIGMSANVGAAKTAAEAVDQKIADTINDAVKQMQQDVNNATTKEEATKALANFKNVAADALVANIKIDDVGITREQALNLLNKAVPSLDGIESTLNDSFLSKETIQATVNKLADTITSTEGTNATKDVAYKMAFNIVFDKLDKTHTANSDPEGQAKGLAGTLSSMLVGQDTDWDQLTDTLVDDAVELALDELMKDKKVARLLKTKLGTETVDELRVEIRKQLVEDPTFMNNVRTQVKTATDNATYGINKGWSDEKVLLGMRRDLLPITDLISSQVSKLGDSAEQIANKKVEDTVHKFLPGMLGDWVSNKINDVVSPTVQNEVQKLGNQATDRVTTFIKQFTCTHEWSEDMELRAATCTGKGQRGKVCTKCGKTKDKYDTDPLDHAEVIDPAVEPTETATGLTEGSHCSRCGVVLTAQTTVPMLDPTIYSQFERADITPAEAEQAGYDSVEAACAALDAALTQAGFDPASAEYFTLQVNSSIGVLPADRFPGSGATGTLSVPAAAGKAKTFYVVQLYTARVADHEAGDIVVIPVEVWGKEMNLTVCGQNITAIAWKAE